MWVRRALLTGSAVFAITSPVTWCSFFAVTLLFAHVVLAVRKFVLYAASRSEALFHIVSLITREMWNLLSHLMLETYFIYSYKIWLNTRITAMFIVSYHNKFLFLKADIKLVYV